MEEEIDAQQQAEKMEEKHSDIFSQPKMDKSDAGTTFVENLRELEPEQAALVLKEVYENLQRCASLVLGQLGSKFVTRLLKNLTFQVQESEPSPNSPVIEVDVPAVFLSDSSVGGLVSCQL